MISPCANPVSSISDEDALPRFPDLRQRVWRAILNWGYFDDLKKRNARNGEMMHQAQAQYLKWLMKRVYEEWKVIDMPDMVDLSEDDMPPMHILRPDSDDESDDSDFFHRLMTMSRTASDDDSTGSSGDRVPPTAFPKGNSRVQRVLSGPEHRLLDAGPSSSSDPRGSTESPCESCDFFRSHISRQLQFEMKLLLLLSSTRSQGVDQATSSGPGSDDQASLQASPAPSGVSSINHEDRSNPDSGSDSDDYSGTNSSNNSDPPRVVHWPLKEKEDVPRNRLPGTFAGHLNLRRTSTSIATVVAPRPHMG